VKAQGSQLVGWRCPVCDAPPERAETRFRVRAHGTDGGVDSAAFRPSSEHFGRTVGSVVRCSACGHGSLAELPPPEVIRRAYADAADPVSVREEPGQVTTATRALSVIERFLAPGPMTDLGCWTGSFLVAARARGWVPVGVEPSAWAVGRARARGLEVRQADLHHHGIAPGSQRLVVLCDVIEHLGDPRSALHTVKDLLEPGGGLYLTTPDAGSLVARVLGRRWWSVLPMHLQYFTRASVDRLLGDAGFSVRSLGTDPKVFTTRYYAERLGGYSPRAQRLGGALVDGLHVGRRLIGPDFRDRMAVLATVPPSGQRDT